MAERSKIRDELIERAKADPGIVGAALAGSAARGTEDAWSDIDLVLQLGHGADEQRVVDEWTAGIDESFGVADTFDVFAGGVRYRVFFLRTSLQVDVSFWPHAEFRATEPHFNLIFGSPNHPSEPRSLDPAESIGMGWLYAIHARSAVARGRLWQAAMMLDDLRRTLVDLKCIRAGLNPWHGREVDLLPEADREALHASRARCITADDLETSRILMSRQLLDEAERHDPDRAQRLREPFAELTRTVR